MQLIKLGGDYTFHVETEGKRLRLVVSRAGVENVCRREMVKRVSDFAQNGDGHLFKGRLQLQISGEWVNVLVKGETVGKIGRNLLREMVEWEK